MGDNSVQVVKVVEIVKIVKVVKIVRVVQIVNRYRLSVNRGPYPESPPKGGKRFGLSAH